MVCMMRLFIVALMSRPSIRMRDELPSRESRRWWPRKSSSDNAGEEGDSRGVASTAQATSSSRSAALSATSTWDFDVGFLDPTGYLMAVHAQRPKVGDDERRMS